MEVFNGGIFAGILRIVKAEGGELSEESQAYLDKMDSLPENTWISLDENHNPISDEDARQTAKDHLSSFQIINH